MNNRQKLRKHNIAPVDRERLHSLGFTDDVENDRLKTKVRAYPLTKGEMSEAHKYLDDIKSKFEDTLNLYLRLLTHEPGIAADLAHIHQQLQRDGNPGYLSTTSQDWPSLENDESAQILSNLTSGLLRNIKAIEIYHAQRTSRSLVQLGDIIMEKKITSGKERMFGILIDAWYRVHPEGQGSLPDEFFEFVAIMVESSDAPGSQPPDPDKMEQWYKEAIREDLKTGDCIRFPVNTIHHPDGTMSYCRTIPAHKIKDPDNLPDNILKVHAADGSPIYWEFQSRLDF
ncbi:hypothetical protein [Shewanella cyperi]|uniref:hypothetical protein n=1 Tax=Shewanella cyperi TaxID=2814292 RepID=UPI001A93DA7F|nr:hypothetical protein [Shewanella cyperi]QSX39774.1 hypothetical protein JYB84_12210 [Shewanella cyperi]